MTRTAREVLADCKYILARLEEETDDQQWRIHWVAVVTLLRTVGHVLTKVDGESEVVRQVSDQLYRRWKSTDPAHEIFREFIEKERNNVLKEYMLGISQGPVAVVASCEDPLTRDLVRYELESIGENIYRPITDGPYAGEDGRTLVALAIEWWEKQLDQIDGI